MGRAKRVRDRGSVTYRHAADALLDCPGDIVLVERVVPRSLVMACPDGCGDVLTINLDLRTDKAWRYYKRRNQLSVFPSVWRDTGCFSHFIIWNHWIVWCDWKYDDRDVIVEEEAKLFKRVLSLCTHEWQHFADLAEQLDEVPWDVNRACRYLANQRCLLIEGAKEREGQFKLAKSRRMEDHRIYSGTRSLDDPD